MLYSFHQNLSLLLVTHKIKKSPSKIPIPSYCNRFLSYILFVQTKVRSLHFGKCSAYSIVNLFW